MISHSELENNAVYRLYSNVNICVLFAGKKIGVYVSVFYVSAENMICDETDEYRGDLVYIAVKEIVGERHTQVIVFFKYIYMNESSYSGTLYFWYELLYIHFFFCFAIILTRKRKLVALLWLYSLCLVTVNVLWLFLTVPFGDL